MADHLSTMENVIVQNRVQLQSSATNDTHSDTSSGQTDCNSNSNLGNFEAENIVSSTQETTTDSMFNVKLCSDSSNSLVNKCDVIDVKSQLPKSLANEKQHIINEQSHIAVTASALSSQNRQMMDDEPKRSHLHISDSSKSKSKSLESGSYGLFFFYLFHFQ